MWPLRSSFWSLCAFFVPLHIFCSLEQFLFHLEHFLLISPRQEEQEQQGFF